MDGILEGLRTQATWCEELGSALYHRLLVAAAADFEAGGPVADLLGGWDGEARRGAVALRLMGAVHALVLAGEEPGLAAHYPSAGGTPRFPEAETAFLDVVRRRAADLPLLPVQTNEVNRSAALLGGFLHLAQRFGRPLRLLEVGASAGLNLGFDRYRYDLGTGAWGPAGSPATVASEWRGAHPPLDAALTVASRGGCDLHPIDVTSPQAARRLLSLVWADQVERFRRLEAALAVAAESPPRVDEAGAAEWAERQLADLPDGHTTVLFHSVVWHYLPEDEQARLRVAIEEAGARLRESGTLAWLRMELTRGIGMQVQVTTWPGGEESVLAACDPHATWVDFSPAAE